MKRLLSMVLTFVMVISIGSSTFVTTGATTTTTTTTSTQTPTTDKLRLEAESAIFTGGVTSIEAPYASMCKVAGNITKRGETVTFNNVPKANFLTIGFAKGGNGNSKIVLYINDIEKKSIAIPRTGGDGKEARDYKKLSIDIDIPSGANIKFKIDSSELGLCFDYIELETKEVTESVAGASTFEEKEPLVEKGYALIKANIKLPDKFVNSNGISLFINSLTTNSADKSRYECKLFYLQKGVTGYTAYIPVASTGGTATCVIRYGISTNQINGTASGIKVTVSEGATKEIIVNVDGTILKRAGFDVPEVDGATSTKEYEEVKPPSITIAKEKKAVDPGMSLPEIIKYVVDNLKQGNYTITFKSALDYDDVVHAIYDEELVVEWLVPDAVGDLTQKDDEYTLYFETPYTDVELKKLANEYRTKVEKILKSIITPGMTEYDKELAIHEYIVKNVKYDDKNRASGKFPDSDYIAYSAIVKGIAVCEGYALATALLLREIGIPCTTINGNAAGGGHAWNIVTIDGKNYHMDTTFDSGVNGDLEKGDMRDKILHNYFNLTDAEASKVYIWDKEKYVTNCNSKDAAYIPAVYSYKAFIDRFALKAESPYTTNVSFPISVYKFNAKNYNLEAIKKAVNEKLDFYHLVKISYTIGKVRGNITTLNWKVVFDRHM